MSPGLIVIMVSSALAAAFGWGIWDALRKGRVWRLGARTLFRETEPTLYWGSIGACVVLMGACVVYALLGLGMILF